MTGEEAAALASVQYVDKQRGIAVVLEGEGGDLKGKHFYFKFNNFKVEVCLSICPSV